MATFLLYLGSYLGFCFILVTASLGGVYVYSCCSCYGCYGVAGAVIRVASGIAIRITYNTAVGIASGISEAAGGIGGAASGISGGSCGDSY